MQTTGKGASKMSYIKHLLDNNKDSYIKNLEGLIKYQEAYDILMEYWDYLPDDDKNLINEKLTKLGL